MQCPTCQSEARKFGRDRDGNQRFQCPACRKTFAERPARPLGDMRISLEKALVVLQHLVEGVSVRATMRLTGTNRNTILDLMVLMGERCERLLSGRIKNVPVLDVQCDEVWSFVRMKQKKAKDRPDNEGIGDAYCFIATERNSKLILAWHLGRRTGEDTTAFIEKLAEATTGNFQVSTDQFAPYRTAVPAILGEVDFAQIVKHYANKVDEPRYSPGEVTAVDKRRCCGNPNMDRACTSHVERQNLTVRMQNRRWTRLTNGFSKKWLNHAAMLALGFAYFNFCRPHMTLSKVTGHKTTPAMAAGLEDHPWTLAELVAKSTQS
jgi:transposase-like protein/IS1 family transposase